MKFELVISMDNAAFDDGSGGRCELHQILLEVAGRVQQCRSLDEISIKDTQGNTVGFCHESD